MIFALLRFRRYDEVWLKSFTRRNRLPDVPCFFRCSRKSVRRFCALRPLFDLDWNCTLGVALTADRERRARLGVNYGDHLTGKSELPFLTVAR